MEKIMRLALLISGGGTTMQEILRAVRDGTLSRVHPALIIASKDDAGGIKKAIDHGIDPHNIVVIKPKSFAHPEEFGEAIIAECRSRGVNFIGQFGWLPLTPVNVINVYKRRIMNQHPGPLDPGREDFGGVGMYGRRVHFARLVFVRLTAPLGLKPGMPGYSQHFYTEVTAHHVTKELDRGAVMDSIRVQIEPDDDVDTLQKRALVQEHALQIRALNTVLDGHNYTIRRLDPLVLDEHIGYLNQAKFFAGLAFPKG